MAVLSVVTLTLLVPAPGSAAKRAVGIVTGGVYHGCGRFQEPHINFSFRGRMLAGRSEYTVIEGTGNGMWFCGEGTPGFTLVGETPSGTFTWNCSGPIKRLHDGYVGGLPANLDTLTIEPTWLFDTTCKTVGVAGPIFSVQIVMKALKFTGYDRQEDPQWTFSGAYQAVRP